MNKIISLYKALKRSSFEKEASQILKLAEGDDIYSEEEDISDEEILNMLLSDDNPSWFPSWMKKDETELEWDRVKEFLERVGASVGKVKDYLKNRTRNIKIIELLDNVDENLYLVDISSDKRYVIDSGDIEFRNNDLKSWAQDIVNSTDLDSWVPTPELDVPSIVYHGTEKENLENIKSNGLECRSNSRGMTNRSVGCAIFTSSEESEVADYGGILLEIDVAGMERDGVLPEVSQEPQIEEYNMADLFCSMFGLSIGDDIIFDIEYGMSPNTFIFHGSIPPKYIKHIE